MKGLSQATGAPFQITIDGEDLIVDPPSPRDFGAIEQHILSLRPNVILLATEAADQLSDIGKRKAAELPPDDPATPAKARLIAEDYQQKADSVLNKAIDHAAKKSKVSQQELADWIDSIEGITYLLWIKLDGRYPGKFTPARVSQAIGEFAVEQLQQLLASRDQSAGLGMVKNSTSSAQGPNATADTEVETEQKPIAG